MDPPAEVNFSLAQEDALVLRYPRNGNEDENGGSEGRLGCPSKRCGAGCAKTSRTTAATTPPTNCGRVCGSSSSASTKIPSRSLITSGSKTIFAPRKRNSKTQGKCSLGAKTRRGQEKGSRWRDWQLYFAKVGLAAMVTPGSHARSARRRPRRPSRWRRSSKPPGSGGSSPACPGGSPSRGPPRGSSAPPDPPHRRR
jgi:hypothetical protein